MKITLLGTGSAIPTGERYQTSLVVESEISETPLLVDCGAGTIHRLIQAGFDLTNIDTLLLTHHHLDHVADVPSLLKARLLQDCSEFTIVGPPGTEAYLSPMLTVDQLAGRADVRFCECETSSFSVNGLDIRTADTNHSAAGFAYRINDVFTFSGDTEASDRIATLADGSMALVHDCAYPDESRSNHATPKALGQTLSGTAVDNVYLTHLYPEAVENAEAIRQLVDKYTTGNTYIADDLDAIEIPEDE